MGRRRKFDIYLVIFLFIATAGYFIFTHFSSESRGVKMYSEALKPYKEGNFETAYNYFGKVPHSSTLKHPALFRQARCATNMGKKDVAIKKYKKIVTTSSKSAIAPISQYNMSVLMYEEQDKRAKENFKKIIQNYPTSDYAIASNYYLGILESTNLPKYKWQQKKAKERAVEYFKTYITKAPDGRFAINSVKALKSLGTKLTNYDNLLIARVYYANGEYENAKQHLALTTLSESWVDFANTEYQR